MQRKVLKADVDSVNSTVNLLHSSGNKEAHHLTSSPPADTLGMEEALNTRLVALQAPPVAKQAASEGGSPN